MTYPPKNRSGLTHTVRVLHRDIGFLVMGFTLIYALSGILLIFRETDFLKSSTQVETVIPAGLSKDNLGQPLHMRRLIILGDNDASIQFKDMGGVDQGVYDKATGAVRYVEKQYPDWIQRMIRLHKISQSNAASWMAILYAAMLLFLALSSPLMFKPGTRPFYRGITLAGIGILVGIVLLALV